MEATSPGVAGGGGERDGAGSGIPLVRHGGGAAAGFRGFGDLELHEQRQIARELAERSGIDAERGGERGQAIAVGVPGRGSGQVEFHREIRGDRGAPVAERSQSSGGAAELEDQRFREAGVQAPPAAREGRVPAGGLEPEGDGQRGLQQGPAEHQGVSVLL